MVGAAPFEGRCGVALPVSPVCVLAGWRMARPIAGSARVGWGKSWPPLGCATSKGPCQPAETLSRTLPPLSRPWLGMPAHPPSSAPSQQNTLTYLQPPQPPTTTKYIGRNIHRPTHLSCPLPHYLLGWPKEALCEQIYSLNCWGVLQALKASPKCWRWGREGWSAATPQSRLSQRSTRF